MDNRLIGRLSDALGSAARVIALPTSDKAHGESEDRGLHEPLSDVLTIEHLLKTTEENAAIEAEHFHAHKPGAHHRDDVEDGREKRNDHKPRRHSRAHKILYRVNGHGFERVDLMTYAH